MIAAPASQTVIRLEGITKSFAGRHGRPTDTMAVQGVDLEIGRGQITSLLGPSGCGKTTILRMIAGFESPTEGKLLHNDRPIQSIGPDRAMVFQRPVLFAWMTVLDNLLFISRGRGFDHREVAAAAEVTLKDVGLWDFRSHYPYELSGGMLQRLQLARALVSRADVMLLDEPFGALDAQTRFAMQLLLQRIFLRYGMAVVMVTHDIDEALFLSDRVVTMKSRPGRVVEDIALDWPRPRGTETFAKPEFGQLKEHLLQTLHVETIADAPNDQDGHSG